MKQLITFLFILMCSCVGHAQRVNTDSLKQLLLRSTSDTTRSLIFSRLAIAYSFLAPDSGLLYGSKAIQSSELLNYKKGMADAYSAYGWNLSIMGNYSLGIEYVIKALNLYEQLNDKNEVGYLYTVLNFNFRELGDYEHAIFYGNKGTAIFSTLEKTRLTELGSYKKINFGVLAETYERMNQLDSALLYTQKAIALDSTESAGRWNVPTFLLANIYFKKNIFDKSLSLYRVALHLAKANNLTKDLIAVYNNMGRLYFQTGNLDSAVFYLQSAFAVCNNIGYNKGKMDAAAILSDVYMTEKKNDSALKYILIKDLYKDSLFNQQKERQIQALVFNEHMKQQQITEAAEKLKRERNNIIILVSIVGAIACAIIYFRLYLVKQQLRVGKMRNQISRDLHDEVGSALGSINILSQTIEEKHHTHQHMSPPDINLIKKISNTARRTMEAMDDIVWTINPDKETLEDLFIRMKEFAHPLADAKNIDLSFQSAIEQERKLSMSVKKNIFLIFKEAFINALKYADSRNITVALTLKNSMLELMIKDDGVGFDPNKETNRNGLKNMFRRVELVSGHLEIRSLINEGTSVKLSCPTG